MPSTSTHPCAVSMSSTWQKAPRSRRCLATSRRSRNRFELRLPRPSGAAPAADLMPATSSALRARWSEVSLCIQMRPTHRVAGAGDVALAEDDLVEVRVAGRRAEHRRAPDEVGAPDAAKALVEARRVERVDRLPLGLEALRPDVERQRVVAAQVLDVDDLQPAAFHLDDHLGQARDPAAGKDMLADEELGVARADVADEVQHAEPARLQEVGMRGDHLAQLVAPRMLEHADRHQLVVGTVDLAEVRLAHVDLLRESAATDLGAQPVDLLRGRVDAGAECAD